MRDANIERRKDESQEQLINQFLEKYYFNKAYHNVRFVEDPVLQGAGVDFLCDGALFKDVKFDVKAQSSAKYINDPRPTFSLEVTTLNRYGDEEITGWFFHAKSQTQVYTFVWVHEAVVDDKKRIRSVEDIKKLEVMSVNATALQDYVDQLLEDYNMDDIYEISQDMRWREKTHLDVCQGIHYSHSPQLVEKPVNLVVQKALLRKFLYSSKYGHCFVTPEGIQPITYGKPKKKR
jgi:hypothetical protein